MIDEIFDREYHRTRTQLNRAIVTGLKQLGRAIAETFTVLNRIEYSAPWAHSKKSAVQLTLKGSADENMLRAPRLIIINSVGKLPFTQ